MSTRLSTVIHGPAGREILAGLSVEKGASTPDLTHAEKESGVDVPVAG